MADSSPRPGPPSDDAGIGHIVNGITWPFTALCMITVAFRFYIRKKFTGALASDDWFMLLAVAFNIVFQASLTTAVYYGYGRPRSTILPDDSAKVFFYTQTCITWAQVTDTIARVSISLLLARIFGTARPWFNYFLLVATTLQGLVSTVAVILGWTEASPVQSIWDFRIPRQQHIPIRVQQDMSLVSSFLIALTDLAYVIIPVIFVSSLRMPLHRKIGVCALLATSLIACAAATTKIAIVILVREGKISLSTGHSASIFITSGIEQSLVIVMGCVPALAPIRKLELHLKFSAIGQSIATLLSRSGRSTSGSSSGWSRRSGRSKRNAAGSDSGDNASEKVRPSNGSGSDVERQGGVNRDKARTERERLGRGGSGILQTNSFVVTTQTTVTSP
ncbi:hypothetical protein V8F06_011736 [Rhypophila decipiens]